VIGAFASLLAQWRANREAFELAQEHMREVFEEVKFSKQIDLEPGEYREEH
jgi:hypothetical protein